MFRSVVKLAVVFVALGMLSVSVSCGKAPTAVKPGFFCIDATARLGVTAPPPPKFFCTSVGAPASSFLCLKTQNGAKAPSSVESIPFFRCKTE